MNRKSIILTVCIPLLLLWGWTIFLWWGTPTRGELTEYFNGEVVYNYHIARILLFINILISSFLYGWISEMIVGEVRGREINLFNSLLRAKKWFPRSFIIMIISWGGTALIIKFTDQIDSRFLFSVSSIFLNGLWITLTFMFYPIVIASQKPVITAMIEAFFVTLSSINRWFHILLALFLVSGGFVFIWIPQGIAQQLTTSPESLTGWMVHFQWIGGYSFTPYWYTDYANTLTARPPAFILAILFFLSSVIATAIKIRVTRILYEGGYLTSESEPVGDYFINPELEKAR